MKLETKHAKVKEALSNFEGAYDVMTAYEFPNKYEDNTSHFSIKFNWEDEYNHTTIDFVVEWDRNVLFVRLVGYFNFTTLDDLIKQMKQHYEKKLN